MKASRSVIAVAAVVVVAVLLVVVPALSSTAARPLVLLNKGRVVKDGTLVGAITSILFSNEHGCNQEPYNGELLVNAKTTDKASFTGNEVKVGCEEESELRGGLLSQLEITGTGKMIATANPKWKVQIPGPCVYEVGRLQGTFTPGATAQAEGFNVATRNTELSAATCTKTAKVKYIGSIFTHAPGSELQETFQAETP